MGKPVPPPPRLVLLVDDDDGVRSGLTASLRRRDHEVVDAPSMAGAREVIRSMGPSIAAAVVDLRLSDGLGLSLLRELRLPPHPIATVVLSGAPHHEAAQVALSESAYKLLHKPCPAARLDAAVRAAKHRTAEIRCWLTGDPMPSGAVFAKIPARRDDFIEYMAALVVTRGKLSKAEARMVEPILRGRDYGDIAGSSAVSVETVRSHVKAILHKLDIDSARGLWNVAAFELERNVLGSEYD